MLLYLSYYGKNTFCWPTFCFSSGIHIFTRSVKTVKNATFSLITIQNNYWFFRRFVYWVTSSRREETRVTSSVDFVLYETAVNRSENKIGKLVRKFPFIFIVSIIVSPWSFGSFWAFYCIFIFDRYYIKSPYYS